MLTGCFRLADYGLAFVTSKDDMTNPIMWTGQGSLGHFAPEQKTFVDFINQVPVDVRK